MGYFETYPIWKEITKEEYTQEEQKIEDLTKNKSDLEKLFYRIQFNESYKANHTYSGGLLDQINGTAKILSTKYFKRIGYQTSYLCGSTEYKFLKQNNII